MNEKLDNMLQDWAARNKPSEEHLNELTRRITTEAAQARYVEHVSTYVPFWSKLGYAGLGAVVAVVVALLYLHSFVPFQSHVPTNGEASMLAAITKDEIQSDKHLFNEMERLFSDRLRWISESNGDVGVGVESIAGGTMKDSSPMLVRLTVVSRKEGENIWKPVWNTDVLLRGEEMVEVVPNKDADNKLALWVYPLADGKVAVDTSLSLDIPVRLSSRMNMVVKQGRPAEIMSLDTGDAEYKVFQTVQALCI